MRRAEWLADEALPLALCALAIVLLWARAWPGSFQFDDFAAIVEEPRVHALAAWWASMPGLRPLLKLSYVASWHVGGGAPWPFLAGNVALHVVNAWLVYALARVLLPRIVGAPVPAVAALLASLLFALHPAQTEAVTYLSGRSTSLMATFWLAALLAWLRGTRRARAFALALFALAMGVKETAIAWPLAVTLVEALDGGWRAGLRRAAPAWALAVAAAAMVLAVPGYRALAASSLATRAPLDNLAVAVDGIGYLVTEPLLRLRVNIDPDIAATAFGPRWWGKAIAILVALAWALGALRAGHRASTRARLAAFAVLWFLAALAPTQTLAARFDIANDRQLYLALPGPALALGFALAAWMGAGRARRMRDEAATGPTDAAGEDAPRTPVRILPLLASAVLVTVLGMATFARNLDYAGEVALWRATVRASPGKSRPWNNLGFAELARGDTVAAREAFARALALDPGDYKARTNLMLLDLAK